MSETNKAKSQKGIGGGACSAGAGGGIVIECSQNCNRSEFGGANRKGLRCRGRDFER